MIVNVLDDDYYRCIDTRCKIQGFVRNYHKSEYFFLKLVTIDFVNGNYTSFTVDHKEIFVPLR